jgi:hypothetical protein
VFYLKFEQVSIGLVQVGHFQRTYQLLQYQEQILMAIHPTMTHLMIGPMTHQKPLMILKKLIRPLKMPNLDQADRNLFELQIEHLKRNLE